ncbi:MAG: hypothetical protein ACON5J_19045 [Rubripirellula sp.]
MMTKLDTGEVVEVGDLLRVGDAAAICGNSRQSVLQWIDGKGRGSKEPLEVGYAFKTKDKPTGIPVISRPYFMSWLERTNDVANPLHNKQGTFSSNLEQAIKHIESSEGGSEKTQQILDILQRLAGPEGEKLRKTMDKAPME